MYTIYDGKKTAGGTSVRAVMAEIGNPYDLVEIDIQSGEHRSDEYTRLNPSQQVPALRLPDGSVLTETTAILMHLADLHPKAGLAPRCGSMERAQLNRWMSYFAMHVYEGENRRAHPENYTSDPSGARGIAEAAAISVKRRYDLFEPELGHGPYFLDDHFTILDIYIWVLVQWRPDYDEMQRDHPKTLRLVEAVMERPKIKPLHEAQFGPGMGNS